MTHAIVTTDLGKTYQGGKEALKGLNLRLNAGEIFGFLGPNGAGKTTAVKLLTGVLTPTKGSAQVLGISPAKDPVAVHRLCGVVTESARMYDHLTGLENLVFYGEVHGLGQKESEETAKALMKEFHLGEAMDRKLAAYSTGMRQKLSFARALMHKPRLLFLDEPTSGMDPESGILVNRMIQRLSREEGVTVFLCTHQLRYAQEICTRFGLINEGRLLMEGSLKALQDAVLPGVKVLLEADGVPAGLPLHETTKGQYEGQLVDEKEVAALVRQVVLKGFEVYQVRVEKPSLEDLYFALTQRKEAL